MIGTNSFKNGLKLEIEGEAYQIVEFQHVKPGKGGAFIRTRLKNLKTGAVIDRTYRSGEKFKEPDFGEKEMQYLYADGTGYCFMDLKTYEQVTLTKEHVGEKKNFLQEQVIVNVLFFNGAPLCVDLPNFVELVIVKSDPGIKGDTASGGGKPATLETGAVIQVPLFVCEGDKVRVDTRTGEYVTRV